MIVISLRESNLSFMEESVIIDIFKGLSFSKKEFSFISSKFEKIKVKKGDIILKAGNKASHQFYVHQGCLRTFHVDNLGKEYTLQFAIKGWWITDYTAYFTNQSSTMNIECIQDAILYKISRNEVEELYSNIHIIESFIRKKLEIAYAHFQKRILEILSKSARQKYISFLNNYPSIEKNIKNYHIASYLGVTTETLSRIRKEIAFL